MYLLDTNTVSRFVAGSPSVTLAVAAAGAENIFLCSIVAGELLYGSHNSNRAADNLATYRKAFGLLPILPADLKASETYGDLKHRLYLHLGKPAGRNRPTMPNMGIQEQDLWIAAIAVANGLSVVTDDKDFQPLISAGLVKVVNWYDRAFDKAQALASHVALQPSTTQEH